MTLRETITTLRRLHERSAGWANSECQDTEALRFENDKERDRHTQPVDYRTLRDLTDIANALPALLDLAEFAVEAEQVLRHVIDTDKTPHYEYHGKRSKDRHGRKPDGVGKRWRTPREMAKAQIATRPACLKEDA